MPRGAKNERRGNLMIYNRLIYTLLSQRHNHNIFNPKVIMRKGSLRFIFFLIVGITDNNQLSADGLGIYSHPLSIFSSGTTYLHSDYNDKIDHDYAHFGRALIFDMNFARDKVFHYRIALIYGKESDDWDYLAIPTEILFNLGFALWFNDIYK